MAKRFATEWDRVTKHITKASDKSFPKIEATLDLSNSLKFSFETGSPDSLESLAGPLRRKVADANANIAGPLTEALNSAMAASWGWSQGARDIIDTGELRDSLEVTIVDGQVNISYSAPYAGLVHYGGYISPYGNASIEKVYLPGRPWVQSTLEGGGPVPQFDFKGYYDTYL